MVGLELSALEETCELELSVLEETCGLELSVLEEKIISQDGWLAAGWFPHAVNLDLENLDSRSNLFLFVKF